MPYVFSKVQGPTDSAAQTAAEGRKKTQIGSDYLIPPGGPFHIHKLTVAKGNVVNAKECSGIIDVYVTSVDGIFEYAYGNGTGGATNSGQNGPAEPIDCRIPCPSGSTLQIFVNDAEAAKDVTIAAEFWNGLERVDSYAAGGGAVDATSATEMSFATITVVSKPGRIKQIRFAGSVVADAEAGSAVLVVDVPAQGLPQEFAVGNGPGGATLGGPNHADVLDVDIGVGRGAIPVNTVITVKLTAAEDLKSPAVSLAIA